MPVATVNERLSLFSELGALAGLYRTVLWMIGRKTQYGRVWPPEADMGAPAEAMGATELLVASQSPALAASRGKAVEAGTRD